MTLLAERLRHRARFETCEAPESLMREAADEIERLRAALRKIAGVHPPSWTTRVAADALNEQNARLDAAIDDMVERYPNTLARLKDR